jgi:predicted Zn-dependent protease
LHRQSGATESRWVTAGSGYLSQSTAACLYAATTDAPVRVVVRWPDATEQSVDVDPSAPILRIAHP